MASEGSSPSRFTQKFLEVLATGIATAASIFLIAHFTGVFVATPPAPGVKQPLAIQDGPQGGTQGRPAEPAPPASAASVVNAAPVAAPPQSNTADQPASSNVTAPKPSDAAETETTPRDATNGAAAQSLDALSPDALAKVDAAHPTSGDTPRRQAVAPIDAMPRPRPAAAPRPAVAPRPADTPTGSIPNAPRRNHSATRPAPVVPPPIAVTQPASQEPEQAAAEPSGTDQDVSATTKRLRTDKPLPVDQAPRPPMPVGQ